MAKRRAARKTIGEIREIVKGFEASGQTRAGYAERQGISVAALDSYRRRVRKRTGFVEIAVGGEERGSFAIALAGGRRIEIGWSDVERAAAHGAALRALIGKLDSAESCSG